MQTLCSVHIQVLSSVLSVISMSWLHFGNPPPYSFFRLQVNEHTRLEMSDFFFLFFFKICFWPLLIGISEERQESGRERRGETCSKGRHERDSNTRHTARPEPICGMRLDQQASGRPQAMFLTVQYSILVFLCSFSKWYDEISSRDYSCNLNSIYLLAAQRSGLEAIFS